mmetsp:Transcript_14597/g.30601  ORF Transcript_14597/g.30601 Transcript_14597/m.30601 type:complete len:202 (+) Transcript_14597:210-815(+)
MATPPPPLPPRLLLLLARLLPRRRQKRRLRPTGRMSRKPRRIRHGPSSPPEFRHGFRRKDMGPRRDHGPNHALTRHGHRRQRLPAPVRRGIVPRHRSHGWQIRRFQQRMRARGEHSCHRTFERDNRDDIPFQSLRRIDRGRRSHRRPGPQNHVPGVHHGRCSRQSHSCHEGHVGRRMRWLPRLFDSVGSSVTDHFFGARRA